MTIKAGDTVFLKSGGPEMTVGKINFWNEAHVWYFDDTTYTFGKTTETNRYLMHRVIPVDALELISAEETDKKASLPAIAFM